MRLGCAGALLLALLVGCDSGGAAAEDAGAADATPAGDGGCTEDCDAGVEVPPGWVLIPAGDFWMGSPTNEPNRDPLDEDRHLVRISRPFLLRATEVTQAEWAETMGNNPAWFADGAEGGCRGDACAQRPIERVNWYEAVTFLNARSDAEGLTPCYALASCSGQPGAGCEEGLESCQAGYVCARAERVEGCDGWRLPTEAEWEHATRAGTDDPRPDDLDDIAWHRSTARGTSRQVGTKDPNPWGLYDVLGNVGEWVNDRYGQDYGFFGRAAEAEVDPTGPAFGDNRVIRGCAWASGSAFCRSAARESQFPAFRSNALGFRAARSIP